MHVLAVARELGIDRVLVPKAAPAFSVLGVLVADYVVDLLRSYVTPLSQVDLGRLRTLMSELTEEVDKELEPAGLDPQAMQTTLFVQMCYPGQNFDMSVPVPEGTMLDEVGLLDLAERFHDQHEAERGFCFRSQQPVVRGHTLLVARGRTQKPDHFAEIGAVTEAQQALKGIRAWCRSGARAGSTRRCTTDAGPAPVPRCGSGSIEEPFTVVVLPPDAMTRLDDMGNYVVTPQ